MTMTQAPHPYQVHPELPELPCLACQINQPVNRSRMCGSCFGRMRTDTAILAGAHTWLGVAMHTPPPAFKAGTIGRSAGGTRPPFRLELHDMRVDISGKLTSWARVVIAEQIGAGAGPADGEVRTVAAWLTERLGWVSYQLWCDDMAREFREAARDARGLVPWESIGRGLPLPCPGCGYLTLTLYSGTDTIACRNRDCGRTMIWAHYVTAVREQHDALTKQGVAA